MEILLIHNPTAGDADHSADDLAGKLQRAGHTVQTVSTKSDDCAAVLSSPEADVVIAAGGDGTVREVAMALAGQHVPLSILPLGSANNLARVLGFDREIDALLEMLPAMTRRTLDLGTVSAPWGTERFLEGIGIGLFPDYLLELEHPENSRLPRERLEMPKGPQRDIPLLLKMLENYQPHFCNLQVDGEDCSGDYLVVEVLNSRTIGPMRQLAADADPGDGWLDLRLVDVRHLGQLRNYLQALVGDDRISFPLPTRRFRCLEMRCDGAHLHLDDDLWPQKRAAPSSGQLSISIESAALKLLVPAGP